MNHDTGMKAGRMPLLLAFVVVLSLGATGALAGQLPAAIPTFDSPIPDNDNFANATEIGSLPFYATVEGGGATTEDGESNYCGSSNNTVWYKFTPTTDMVLRAWTGQYETVLTAYRAQGPNIGDLSFIKCGSWSPSIQFQVQAGATYYFQVGTSYYYSGALQLNVQEVVPPENDNFANATEIDGLPFNATVDNSGASMESGEPQTGYTVDYTVWYKFTPNQTMRVRAAVAGNAIILVAYRANSPNLWDLSYISSVWGSSMEFQVQAGVTYYFQVGTYSGVSPGNLQISVEQLPSPANDNFADAKVITALPFNEGTDSTYATTEVGEPTPTCNSIYRSIWYAYTPATSGLLTTWLDDWGEVLAVYTGNDLANLNQVACRTFWGGGRLSFHGEAGTTYYIQAGRYWDGGGWQNFYLDVAPPPVASFGLNPYDPTIFDTVQFNDNSWDPAEVGIETRAWDFGDGGTSRDSYPTHQYARDGDYTVNLTVTTADGRTASTSQTVHVATHDVAIVKLVAPNAARVGQTRPIVVEMKNSRYPERVEIQLLKSVPGGFQWVTTTVQNIPVRSGGRTTSVMMSYTFAKEDATMGKVTFRAVATIQNARDALPADNEAISAPTKVSK